MTERVVVDLLRWGVGGTQTYARTVARRLHARYENVWLVCDDAGRDALFPGVARAGRVITAGFDGRDLVRRYWYQRHTLPRLLRELSASTYFVPGESTGVPTPTRGLRVVRMLRNMLPLDPAEARRFEWRHYPFTRLRISLLRSAMQRGLPRADRTIFISDYSRQELLRAVTLKSTVLIRHGIEVSTVGEVGSTPAPLIERPYVLYVSATYPYKRHLEMIEAHRIATTLDPTVPELVLAGPVVGHYGDLVREKASLSGASVRVLGEVDGPTARALMRSADALLFGSTCECCPNVLLEYLAAGRPILCSAVGPMPEIGGTAVVYSDPKQPAVWAADLVRLLQDREFARDRGHRAAERARDFDVESVVEETYRALTNW